MELDRVAGLPQRRVAEAEVAFAGAVGPWVGEVVLEAVVQLQDEAVVAPYDEVVEVDVEQHLGGGVVVAGLAAQLELG